MAETERGPWAPNAALKVLVVDDHVLLAEMVVSALSGAEGFEVETAPDVEAAHARIVERGPFDVVLLDYDVPGMDALNGLRRLIEANVRGVALFSGVVGWSVVDRAMEIGAAGFLPKTMPLKSMLHAIRFIADGDVYLPAEYMRRAMNGADNPFGLKPREARVLAFLGQGLQNKEIGRELNLEETIVKMDVKSICRKLNVRNRTEAVIMAHKEGLC